MGVGTGYHFRLRGCSVRDFGLRLTRGDDFENTVSNTQFGIAFVSDPTLALPMTAP
jgi:hypothetical protein